MLPFLISIFLVPITVIGNESSPYRWNLVPKPLLKKLCNLDDSLPICAWKRHPFSTKKEFSKWQICRDHPELNLCKWHNGGMVTLPVPSTTTAKTEDSAEAPPTSDSIFVNEPDMMISSKWSDSDILQETVQKELKNQPNRFEGQLHRESESAEVTSSNSEKFDESIMSANGDVFSS
uniref:Secreted protein n=1 Tax=Caenorhabditis japonica TaxID=281687 RepID=A0A8R1I249_CAEJA